MKKFYSPAGLGLFMVCCLAVSVIAGEAQNTSLETMTVTAQKHKENIQDIPGSVSALNDIQIEDAGISSIKDIDQYIPNFEIYPIYGAGGYQSIRGQGNLNYGSPAVGYYIDDVPATFGLTGVQTSLFDIERIEILRGPQGNLYGMNSPGGVVNIITKKPGNTFGTTASTEYGSYNLKAFKGSVNGPVIADKLFVRLGGFFKSRDSYIEEEGARTHEEERTAGRFQVRWLPSDKTDIIFTASHDNYYCDFDPMVVPAYDVFKIINRGLVEGEDISDTSYSLRIKHHASRFDITSITALADNERDATSGKDYTSGGDNLRQRDLEKDDREWAQEIRFASVDDDSRFKWLLGGFYLHGIYDSYYNMRYDTGTAGAPTGIYKADISTAEIETDAFSLFGQTDYTFMEKFTFTAGLRYDYAKRTSDFNHTKFGVVKGDYDHSTSWKNYSPKVSLAYRANGSIMTYLSAAKGYKAGGYGAISLDTPEAAIYDPEHIWSYEGGIKTNWLNNKIIANMSIFYTTVDDIQIQYVDPASWDLSIRNAAEAVTWGVELESIIRPVKNLRIVGSLGLLETEFKEHKIDRYEGNAIPFTPKYNAGLVVQYNFLQGMYIMGESVWHGKSYFTEDNLHSQDDYMVANAKLGYETEHFNVNVYVNNMFDETYFTILNKRGNVEKGVTGAPLTWGIQATIRF